MSTVITGLYETPNRAAMAVQALESEGVPSDDISLLIGDNFDRDAFAVRTHSKLAEGVAVGATSGGAIGALIGGLTAVGTVASGGAGLLVAGPIVAALAAAGTGATAGGVLGGLVGATIPEHEVKHYEDALSKGSVLVGVTCEGDDSGELKDIAKRTLKNTGAIKVSHA
ncbi:MAG: hypothetical protein ACREV5_21850 [Steroidobacter sp.]